MYIFTEEHGVYVHVFHYSTCIYSLKNIVYNYVHVFHYSICIYALKNIVYMYMYFINLHVYMH